MLKGVNKVIKSYIYWDIVINSAWGLVAPVFSIFLLEKIAAGDVVQGVKIAGFATLFYWLTKAIFQIPIGNYLDKNHGEIDDFWFYVTGSLMTGFVPLGFLISQNAWQIYLLQIFHAIGMSMVIPSSYAIFIRHVDMGREAYESSLDSTLLGVGAGISGAIGGVMAGNFGFKLIFILTSLLTFISVLFIFFVKKDMEPKVPRNIHEVSIQKTF